MCKVAGASTYGDDQFVTPSGTTQTRYTITLLPHHCQAGYEAILYADANIPEPTTTALFALGLIGLAARLRRRS